MTAADRVHFAEEMARFYAAFAKPETAEDAALKAEVYFEALQPYEFAEVSRAVREAIRNYTGYFPPASYLIALIRAERRRMEAQRSALPAPSEATPEERAAVPRLLDEFYRKLAAAPATERPSPRIDRHEPTPEEIARHEQRKAIALERYREGHSQFKAPSVR